MNDDRIAEIRARHEAGPHSKLPPMGDPARVAAIDAGWRTFCAEADADRAFLLAEVDRLRAEIERLREAIRTIRARCVELDDSDAVSETLDIATAVLEASHERLRSGS